MRNGNGSGPALADAGDRFGRLTAVVAPLLAGMLAGCAAVESQDRDDGARSSAVAAAPDYCELPAISAEVLETRPSAAEPPIDDVNWFARPVPHAGDDRIVAFASHDQNYLYNLTTGARVRVPDRSDAVATPDGRYLTVPSYYTPDSTVRFYPVEPMLERLAAGEDALDVAPVFVHDHPAMKRVYYQSTGVLSEEATAEGGATSYRLMFSGTQHESGFRIVDYRFVHDPGGALLRVEPSEPMTLCPEVENDLNTPFISKDGRHLAAYTSGESEPGYAPGASLKVFRISAADPAAGTTSCDPVADLGFAAGKADFSFDGSMLAFHTSQGGYLTPFVNGGLNPGTITDVAVARLDVDSRGDIRGHTGAQRLTTSLEAGVGSYFPAFFPDGALFYIANAVPRDSEREKRFHFRVVDPQSVSWKRPAVESPEALEGWHAITGLWERFCSPDDPRLTREPFPHQAHESPFLGLALSAEQCHALLDDAQAEGTAPATEAEAKAPIGEGGVPAAAAPTDTRALRSFCDGLGA